MKQGYGERLHFKLTNVEYIKCNGGPIFICNPFGDLEFKRASKCSSFKETS